MSLLAALSHLFPALIVAIPLARRWPASSLLCLAAVSWAVGQVIATPTTYLLSCLLVGAVSPTLAAASKLLLALEAVALLVLIAVSKTRPWSWLRDAFRARGLLGTLLDTSFLAGALCFSYFLFAPHVIEEGGSIYRSSIYWDFTAHYPIVQNFVYGDNFPAKDETAGELPLLYHFFGDLQVATVSALGTSLAASFLWTSVLSLVSLLILLREFAREIFRSEAAGWAAALFAITSSDMRWMFDLFRMPCGKPVWTPFVDHVHPLAFSVPTCALGDFNVSMFNLFYFVEERHVLFSSVLVLVAAMLLRGRGGLTLVQGACLGGLLGLFSSWNGFIAPMLLLLLIPGLLYRERRLGVVAAACVLAGAWVYPAIITQQVVTMSGWFREDALVPHLNARFATARAGDEISAGRFLLYYGFSLGPMIACALVGLGVMWKWARADFFLFVSMLLGTFLLINSVQALPQSIYENHKWVKPWQGFLDIAAAAPIGLLLSRRSLMRALSATLILAVMLGSGVAEAIPFFAWRQREHVIEHPSAMIDQIRSKTGAGDVFATHSSREALMAGRRVYVLDSADIAGTIPRLHGLGFNFEKRAQSQQRLYAAQASSAFCSVARELGVAVVEFSPEEQAKPLFSQLRNHVIIEAEIARKGSGNFAYVSTDFCAEGSPVAR